MNYRTIDDLNRAILGGLHIFPRDIDLIVGIPRSGMFPANLLALYLNCRVTDLGSFINGHIYQSGERGKFIDAHEFKKVLVVDDSIASGAAMERCKNLLKGLEGQYDIKYCAIYVVPEKKHLVDYYVEIAPLPRYFQWNIMNHTILKKACFDIDGVLCVDPTHEENDDGPRYRQFLLNAKPLFIPGAEIGTLVTSRLEKYRAETEEWLARNGVKYGKLVMLDLPDMAARRKANCHGRFKAEEYKKPQYVLFVESNQGQAEEINRITGKPVLCTANFKMVFDSQSVLYNIKQGEYLPWLRRAALKLRNRLRRH